MGFRLRKSIKVMPGVRLNVSKTGLGASVGGKHGRYSAHSSGRRTVSAGTGIPGVYYQKGVGSKRGRGTSSPAPPAASPPKPGLFAPKGEKQLYNAIRAQDVQAIRRVGDEHPSFRLVSYSLAGLMLLEEDPTQAKKLLDIAFAMGMDPSSAGFVAKYLFTRLELSVADGITAELPVNRDAVGLALAELRQGEGDLEGAIDIVEQLEPTTYSAVSLGELCTGRLESGTNHRRNARPKGGNPPGCRSRP